MPAERLPQSTQTLYLELLDQSIQAEAERVARRLPARGQFVSKTVKGGLYWYLQRHEAGRKRQYYVGRDSESLVSWMRYASEGHRELELDDDRRAELVEMLVLGGATREDASTGRVLEVLAEAGVFRLGGVLIGTQAFRCYGNALGVRFESQTLRTQDVDLAYDPAVPVAIDPARVPRSIQGLLQKADARFLAVPSLDPRSPSTAFKVRGRDLRVDLVAPARSPEDEGPIRLPHLQAAAQPVAFLDYLLEETIQAVVLSGDAPLVNLPGPGRFALHKLWLSGLRPTTFEARARKDLRQGGEMLEVLVEDRPGEVRRAWNALTAERQDQVATAARALPDAQRQAIEALI